MEERIGIEERLLLNVRDGVDAAILLARAAGFEATSADDAKLKELAQALEDAASALDGAMVALLDAQDEEGEE